MNMSKDELRKIKRPDEFQKKIGSYIKLFVANTKLIVSLFTILIVGLIALWLVNYKKVTNLESVISELYQVEKKYDAENKSIQDKKDTLTDEVKALRKKLKLLTKVDKKSSEKTKLKSKGAIKKQQDSINKKIEVIEEQRDSMQALHEKSRAGFVSFYKKNKNKAIGWAVAVKVGKIDLDNKEYLQAKNFFKEAIPSVKNNFYKKRLLLLLVGALEELQEYDSALKQIQEVKQIESKEKLPSILAHEAGVLFKSNKKTEALALIETILKDHKDSEAATQARALKSLISI